MANEMYRGYNVITNHKSWKIYEEGKLIKDGVRYGEVENREFALSFIDRLKREERREIEASIQRVDAQVRR
mgnify:CR=1 FL=1|tara:strand:- start:748 stop:960 length:213 start_codon:yes stop_codon:yes gene_type:complete